MAHRSSGPIDFRTALVKGERYYIRYRLQGQRKVRGFVGIYLGVNKVLDELDFSLRPAFGTSSLKETDVISSQVSNKPCGMYD